MNPNNVKNDRKPPRIGKRRYDCRVGERQRHKVGPHQSPRQASAWTAYSRPTNASQKLDLPVLGPITLPPHDGHGQVRRDLTILTEMVTRGGETHAATEGGHSFRGATDGHTNIFFFHGCSCGRQKLGPSCFSPALLGPIALTTTGHGQVRRYRTLTRWATSEGGKPMLNRGSQLPMSKPRGHASVNGFNVDGRRS